MNALNQSVFILSLAISFPLLAQVCPGSDEVEAKISHVYNGKTKVIVCGFEEIGTKPEKGKLHLNDFSVYAMSVEQKASKIFSAGAVENYWVSHEEKKGIIFEELIWMNGRLKAFLKSEIICDDSGCIRSEPVCILKRPKSQVSDITRQIDKRLRSKFTRIQLPLSGMVELTFVEALAGNSLASAFFENTDWPNKLDANAAQTFVSSKKVLDRVNQMSCWKKPLKKR